ncbi:MAG: hypothetical protein M1449_11445, partial [Candidatus Thermoplasmatota archaeon]|nr:hypothetical protein [Candidatus Thermoplasmatota archaeon]
MRLAAACLCVSALVHAADRQDPAALQAHAERFLHTQIAGLPGKATIRVKPPRAALPAENSCPAPCDDCCRLTRRIHVAPLRKSAGCRRNSRSRC